MPFYLDTSAAAKLVVAEIGSKAMHRWAVSHADDVVASDLVRTELLRATVRSAPEHMTRARAVLDSITLIHLTTDICERAGQLEPVGLRSLDALHLASALSLGDALDAVVTYDERLAEASKRYGITVLAPA